MVKLLALDMCCVAHRVLLGDRDLARIDSEFVLHHRVLQLFYSLLKTLATAIIWRFTIVEGFGPALVLISFKLESLHAGHA